MNWARIQRVLNIEKNKQTFCRIFTFCGSFWFVQRKFNKLTMKPFIVISCLVLAAMAKPQGYSYSAPSAAALSVALLPPHSASHISVSSNWMIVLILIETIHQTRLIYTIVDIHLYWELKSYVMAFFLFSYDALSI